MKQFAILYGSYETFLQKKAVKLLTEFLLDDTMVYPRCEAYQDDLVLPGYCCIYVGTRENHPYIRAHADPSLSHAEGYSIHVKDDTVMIEGYDEIGAVYGCIDFYNSYILKYQYPGSADRYFINFLEKDAPLPDFEQTSYPKIRERGIWTWGHVIYDYRRFIDHMVLLKMNTLILWNDHVPVNAKDLVSYAHDNGIRLYWGYSWFWDTNCALINTEMVMNGADAIFEQYQREYSATGADGIYFQSFTEMSQETINGHLIADLVTAFVNHTAELFYKAYPDLEIQFGLHADSVRNRLPYISRVNPKMRIVWENCGAFPFSYLPDDVGTFDETVDFVKKIAVLRGEGERFGAVTKGFTKLDWPTFRHMDGPICLGQSLPQTQRNRVIRKENIWRYLQAYWLVHADKCLEMIRVMQKMQPDDLLVTALVEDGMFEENIMYPVALYAEMLWDSARDLDTLMSETALRKYITFA